MGKLKTAGDEPNTYAVEGGSNAVVAPSGTGCKLNVTQVHKEGVGWCTPTQKEYLRYLDGKAAQIRGED